MLVTPALCEAETGGSLISRTARATQNKKEVRKSIGLGRMSEEAEQQAHTNLGIFRFLPQVIY